MLVFLGLLFVAIIVFFAVLDKWWIGDTDFDQDDYEQLWVSIIIITAIATFIIL